MVPRVRVPATTMAGMIATVETMDTRLRKRLEFWQGEFRGPRERVPAWDLPRWAICPLENLGLPRSERNVG